MITKYNVFILTIILFIFNISWAKEKETPFTSKTKFELTPTQTLALKFDEFSDISNYIVDLKEYGSCIISTNKNRKKGFTVFSNSKYKTMDAQDSNYGENVFSFSLANHTAGGEDLSMKCVLELKSSKKISVDFTDNELTRKNCLSKNGEIVILFEKSVLRGGPKGQNLTLPYLLCEKREPKISKEQLADFFKKANLSINFKAEDDPKYIPNGVEDHSSSKTEATGR